MPQVRQEMMAAKTATMPCDEVSDSAHFLLVTRLETYVDDGFAYGSNGVDDGHDARANGGEHTLDL